MADSKISNLTAGTVAAVDDFVFVQSGVTKTDTIQGILDLAGGSGVWGISDTSGAYTFYATIALANAAASSGDVIELFADVTETSGVEWILKDGVNYNLNGHTYDLNVATTEDTFTDNNVAVTCKIFNGVIKRTGGTISISNSRVFHLDNTGTTLYSEGVTYESDFGTVGLNDGVMYGGKLVSTVVATNIAYWDGASAEGYNLEMIFTQCEAQITGNKYVDCAFSCENALTVDNNGADMFGCYVYSAGGTAINAQACTLDRCTFISDSGYGVNTTSNNITMTNCFIKSTSTWAFICTSGTGHKIHSCYIESTAGHALYNGNVADIYNCTIISSADTAIGQANGQYYNCNIESTWNNAAGHGVEVATAGCTVSGCYVEVANSSANCMKQVSGTPTVTYQANTWGATATTPVNASIVQGQTNTEDTYGNVQIG